MNCSAERRYSESMSMDHRKKYAQFFTPAPVAEVMAKWLLSNDGLQTVLEPAFGLGIFSRALLRSKPTVRIKGFDVDPVIYGRAKEEFSHASNVDILLEDYIYNDWGNQYDGIICNPPYFKFHDYDNKSALREIEGRLGCKLNGFTNLYTLFLLKSISQLKEGGRCAYIIPSEFMNSDYGKLVKRHLLAAGVLRHIVVFDFEENLFDDALTTAAILLCAKDGHGDMVRFSNVGSLAGLREIERLVEQYPRIECGGQTYGMSELLPELKWRTYYQTQNGQRFKNLVDFSCYAKVVRGIATGANAFFTFNQSKARQFGIDEKFLLPCICHSTDVEGCSFDVADFELLKQRDKSVFLLNAVNSADSFVFDYLRKGEEERINQKHLTASRSPWYALEKRKPAPIWVSVFNRSGLRFIRNKALVANLTTFHCVYPQLSLFSDVSVDLLFAYLLTPTARQIFEDNRREYGNGLKKFEPNDLNKGKMLDLSQLSVSGRERVEHLYATFSKTNREEIVSEIDNVFVSEFAK